MRRSSRLAMAARLKYNRTIFTVVALSLLTIIVLAHAQRSDRRHSFLNAQSVKIGPHHIKRLTLLVTECADVPVIVMHDLDH